MNTLKTFLKSHPKQILIFDFDETIARIVIDWTLWHKGVAEIIAQFDSDHVFNPGREHIYVNDSVKKYGKPLRDALWNFNEAYETTRETGLAANEPLIAFIKNDKNYRKQLYTSNSKRAVSRFLHELGIETLFEQKCFRNDVDFIKPDPQGFWNILYDKSVPLQNYLMIGDSSSDEGMAKAVGMDFFKVSM
jgi:HAD superfamily hydrolase (TIGR01549 family)